MKFTDYLTEGKAKFEIKETLGMTVKNAEKMIDKNWHANLTYNGIEFFDSIYMDTIINVAMEELELNGNNGQESYLGYLPEEDLFISGYDTWEDEYADEDEYSVYSSSGEGNGNVAYVKVTGKGKAKVTKTEGWAGLMMYGTRGSYKKLKAKHKNLVDIRLD